jgi:SAM-dependent methyltransferase
MNDHGPQGGSTYRVCPDAILTLRGDHWILSNPRTRTHVALDEQAAAALTASTASRSKAEWDTTLAQGHGHDRTIFSAEKGLWSDPTGVSDGPVGGRVAGRELFELLRKRWLVHSDEGRDYAAYLAPLTSVLDHKLGNFHERVGQYQMLKLRLREKWRWWHDQKFTPDGLALKDGPYKFVQEHFFDRYFGQQDLRGSQVLDFACGNGYYADKFARLGAKVIGIDTSQELIEIARKNFGKRIVFHDPRDPDESLAQLNGMPAASIDLIYMSDVMLLLVESFRAGSDQGGLKRLLGAFHRLLAPRGRMQMMEPNGLFWLGGIYGGTETPYTIVSEYRKPIYNGSPTTDVMINSINAQGFCLIELVHPEISEDSSADPWLRARAHQFTHWDLFKFAKHP